MATCPMCGKKLAFGAKRSVVPTLELTTLALQGLRASADQLPEFEEFDLSDETLRSEFDTTRARFAAHINQLIADGHRLESLLHQVVHNMSSAYIDWPVVQTWLMDAKKAVITAHNH